jgi:hypothetical protein
MPEERDLKQELFGQADGPVITPLGAVKEAFAEFKEFMAPGLTLDKISSDIGQQLTHMADLGRSELANALFGNGAFVLYSHEPKNDLGNDGPQHAQDHQPMPAEPHSQHHERGLSM